MLYPWATNNTRREKGGGLGTSLHHEKQVPNLHHTQIKHKSLERFQFRINYKKITIMKTKHTII